MSDDYVSTIFIKNKWFDYEIEYSKEYAKLSPCAEQQNAELLATMTSDLPGALQFELKNVEPPCGLNVWPSDDNDYNDTFRDVFIEDRDEVHKNATTSTIEQFGPSPAEGFGCQSCIYVYNYGALFSLDGKGYKVTAKSTTFYQISGLDEAVSALRHHDYNGSLPFSATSFYFKNIGFTGNLLSESFSWLPSNVNDLIHEAGIYNGTPVGESMEYVAEENVTIDGDFTFRSKGCNQTIDLSGVTYIGGSCCCVIYGREDLKHNCHTKDVGNLFNESCTFTFKGPAFTSCSCPDDHTSFATIAGTMEPILITLFVTALFTLKTFRSD